MLQLNELVIGKQYVMIEFHNGDKTLDRHIVSFQGMEPDPILNDKTVYFPRITKKGEITKRWGYCGYPSSWHNKSWFIDNLSLFL